MRTSLRSLALNPEVALTLRHLGVALPLVAVAALASGPVAVGALVLAAVAALVLAARRAPDLPRRPARSCFRCGDDFDAYPGGDLLRLWCGPCVAEDSARAGAEFAIRDATARRAVARDAVLRALQRASCRDGRWPDCGHAERAGGWTTDQVIEALRALDEER